MLKKMYMADISEEDVAAPIMHVAILPAEEVEAAESISMSQTASTTDMEMNIC